MKPFITASLFACCVTFVVEQGPASARADTFDADFHQACMQKAVSAVEKSGGQADANYQKMANGYCDCAVVQIKAKFSQPDLVELTGPSPGPEIINRLKPILQQCHQENFHQ